MNNQKLFEVKDMIVKTMPVGEIGTNCYLLGDESAKVCARTPGARSSSFC